MQVHDLPPRCTSNKLFKCVHNWKQTDMSVIKELISCYSTCALYEINSMEIIPLVRFWPLIGLGVWYSVYNWSQFIQALYSQFI